jgi:hypothetical protein
MATLWIRYEMTYDGFHKNADRIHPANGNKRMGLSVDITCISHGYRDVRRRKGL